MKILAQLILCCTLNSSRYFIFQDWEIMTEEIKIDCGEREASYPDERLDRITAVRNCDPSHFLCRDSIQEIKVYYTQILLKSEY